MKIRPVLIALSILMVSAMAGFYIGESMNGNKGVFQIGQRVDSDNDTATVMFDKRSIDLLRGELDGESRFYVDTDRDGATNFEIDVERTGEIETYSSIVELQNRTYRLYFRYSDEPEKQGDGWLELIRAERT